MLTEDAYLALVERLQQAMAVEPFCPPEADVLRLVAAYRDYERLLRERDAENERLRAELAYWKPSRCGKIFPFPRPGEVVLNCAREYDHEGPHQADTGEVWVFARDKE